MRNFEKIEFVCLYTAYALLSLFSLITLTKTASPPFLLSTPFFFLSVSGNVIRQPIQSSIDITQAYCCLSKDIGEEEEGKIETFLLPSSVPVNPIQSQLIGLRWL